MTHLTQVLVDYATAAKRGLRDAYDWHQFIWQFFPGCDGQARTFLSRLNDKADGFSLLIVSPVEPARPDWFLSDHWKTKKIPADYFKHSRYRFQLCANPTKKIAVQNADGSFKKNGRRVPLCSREDLVAWIKRKGEECGFIVEEEMLRTIRRGPECFQIEKRSERGLHNAVEFQGLLRVIDPVNFYESFRKGIGSAKAFGFGLLVIVPVGGEQKG